METVHEVRVLFTCIFRRWYWEGKSRYVEADEPICIVAYYILPGSTTDVEAGAKGWLEVEKGIKEGDELDIGTIIARVYLSIPI